jgi:myxalamid-type nonribosomal peptide synthetase MxaA
VTAVAGDVVLPRLGLPEADWQRLAATLVEVYHCAAAVDGTAPYASLAAQNVHGTARVLALALHGGSGDAGAGSKRRVEVNHVSTLGCTRQGGEEKLDPMAGGPDGMGGYAQSKWVAEQVVHLAQRELGAAARVFRPGVVAGHSKSGASNARDLVSLLVCGLAREGILPDRDPAVPPHWNLCPVDFVAAAVAHIAAQPTSLGGVFHLCAPTPLPLSTVATWLAGLGYPLRHVSPAAFRAAVRAAPEDHPLFLVRCLIHATPECTSPAAPAARSRPSRRRASAALAGMRDAPCDRVTREAFGAAVAFFERDGLMGPLRVG